MNITHIAQNIFGLLENTFSHLPIHGSLFIIFGIFQFDLEAKCFEEG